MSVGNIVWSSDSKWRSIAVRLPLLEYAREEDTPNGALTLCHVFRLWPVQ
jgi:hypothetical protein